MTNNSFLKLCGFSILIIAAAPAFTVNSSNILARVIWLVIMVVLPFSYFWLTSRPKSVVSRMSVVGKRRYWPDAPVGYVEREKKLQPIFFMILGALVLVAFASFAISIAVTYDVTEQSVILGITSYIISWGEWLSPFIERLSTVSVVKDKPQAIRKLQTIMSLQELWSILFALLWLILMISLTKKERILFIEGVINWEKAPIKSLLIFAVCLLFFYIYWIGAIDFSSVSTRGRYRCLMKVECYATDDLLLIGTAIFKSISAAMLFSIVFTALLKLWYHLANR